MKDLRNQSIEYKKELEQKLKEIEEYLEMAPAGSLHCERRGADVRYFLCDEAEEDQKPGKGKYITKGHDQLVQELAQKKYYERLKPELESEISFLDRLIRKCEAEKKERVYGEMNYYRKKLVRPMFEPVEDRLERWFRNYETIRHTESDEWIRTYNGKYVRTKSEKIIADELTFAGIPYKYECRVLFEDYESPLFPKFTVINMRTGKEFYWEHLIMSEHDGNLSRIALNFEIYARHGIHIGDRLLLSYETPFSPLDVEIVRSYIRDYLL